MGLLIGEQAPEFRLRGVDNAYWRLGQPDERRAVMLVFLHREVASCRVLLPYVERVHRKAHARPGEILGLCLNSHRDTLELAEDFCLTFPMLIESPGLETFRSYRVSSLPTILLLDHRLSVADRMIGWSKDRFEEIVLGYLRAVDARSRSIWEPEDDPPTDFVAEPIADLPVCEDQS